MSETWEETMAKWNSTAAKYEETHVGEIASTIEFATYRNVITVNPTDEILVVGSGAGHLMEHLLETTHGKGKVIGIECAENLIFEAERRLRGRFRENDCLMIHGDALDNLDIAQCSYLIKDEENQFDKIYICNVLTDIKIWQWDQLLCLLKPMLKDGGVIVIDIPYMEDYVNTGVEKLAIAGIYTYSTLDSNGCSNPSQKSRGTYHQLAPRTLWFEAETFARQLALDLALEVVQVVARHSEGMLDGKYIESFYDVSEMIEGDTQAVADTFGASSTTAERMFVLPVQVRAVFCSPTSADEMRD